jgi:hypothetical protein
MTHLTEARDNFVPSLVIQDCGYVKGIEILFYKGLSVMLVLFYMMYSVCTLKEKFTLGKGKI